MGLIDRYGLRTIFVATTLGLLGIVGACTVGGDDQTRSSAPTSGDEGLGEPTAAASTAPAYFFSQNARSGTYRTTSDGVELVLDDVADVTVAITERPNRGATHLRTSDFVDDWDAQFGDDPPNATIAVVGSGDIQSEAALELLRPTYDPAARRLTYPARVLTGSLPCTFVDASVMIDDAGLPVRLNVVDQTDDEGGASVVLYRPNLLGPSDVVAWTVLDLDGPGDSEQVVLGALSAGATDSFGTLTAQLSAGPGSAFQVVTGPGGTTMDAAAPTGNDEISIRNDLGAGVLDATVYENGKLLSVATNVEPGDTAVFRYASSIWISSTPQVVEGEVMSEGALSDATELRLEGISSADLVITGGGGQPYEFDLQNVQS